jgi:hypothetical protein
LSSYDCLTGHHTQTPLQPCPLLLHLYWEVLLLFYEKRMDQRSADIVLSLLLRRSSLFCFSCH